jgi:beta-phosphoglucomutase
MVNRMSVSAIIFDLDGVIVSTDEYHYQAWKKIAEQEDIYFNRELNEKLRGVSRLESLSIILEKADRMYEFEEMQALANTKNDIYRESLEKLTPADIMPGVEVLLERLRLNNVKVAIGSSSKNADFILDKIGLISYFDSIISGKDIKNSKPDPEVFLLAAQSLSVSPESCVVVEDADAGVEAALAAGMKVVGVGAASTNSKAHMKLKSLTEMEFTNLTIGC